MAKIQLYKYQKKLKKQIYKQFKKGRRHVIARSETGSGKTIIFCDIASQTVARGKKVLILTDRIELLGQAGGSLEKFKLKPSLISRDTKYLDKTKSCYVAMSQTLRNRVKNPIWRDFVQKDIDLIIIDEAHKQEFNHMFEDGFLDKSFVIGFTATPARGGKMTQLGVQYDVIVEGPSIQWLIKKEYLLNCDTYDLAAPDLSNVKTNALNGDYSEYSMFKTYDKPKLYAGLTNNYKKLVPGEKMIVFCCNVDHAIKTTKKLVKAGISAKFVCSKKSAPKEPRKWNAANKALFKEKFKAYKQYDQNFYKHSGERVALFKAFKENKFTVLVNVDIATTGFDDPGVRVVALNRATKSLVLYMQMIGRGGRTIKDGSELKTHFTVLDFGGNVAKFGAYDTVREWSLWHEPSKASGGVAPMKICGMDSKERPLQPGGKVKKGCERIIPASLKICPKCGFKPLVLTQEQEVELALAEAKDENGISIKKKSFSDMTFEDLTKYREIKKRHIFWLYNLLWARDKATTIKEYASWANWKHSRTHFVINEMNKREKNSSRKVLKKD